MSIPNIFHIAATVAALFVAGVAVASPVTISRKPSAKAFCLASAGRQTVFVVGSEDADVVGEAAKMVASDIGLITGRPAVVARRASAGAAVVVAGTLGHSELVGRLARSGQLDVSGVEGRWEAYGLALVEHPMEGVSRALVVFGSTPRGTAYGLLEISRLAGVSPWVWWADVLPEQASALYVSGDRLIVGEPSVKYRGIFINDEDWGFKVWAARTMDTELQNIGPRAYERVFQLMLRLRANTLWPAMHDCSTAFWTLPENVSLARRYAIVLGSSHCESLLRNNVQEWGLFGGTATDYQYPSNRAMVQRYWAQRVGESRGLECMYTLGMRGVHDGRIQGYKGTSQIREGLTEIIGFQRQLLSDSLGPDITAIPQVFCPYKEVLQAYNSGLAVPDDVTLCWVDDNHGYIRQLPDAQEQQRSGGHGIYYHLSYWGSPYDYLWLSSTSPALCSYELTKAYENNVRTLWMFNVGDIKPAEETLSFCMELAWDISAWPPDKAAGYCRSWAARTFGPKLAGELGCIKADYYRLAAGGKPEHTLFATYSRREAEARLEAYDGLVRRVKHVRRRVPERLQDAFFQLVEYPVCGAALMNVKTLCYRMGMMDAARTAYAEIQELTRKYNKEISGGKWDGMMDAAPHNYKHHQFNAPDELPQGAPSAPLLSPLGGKTCGVESSPQGGTGGGLLRVESSPQGGTGGGLLRVESSPQGVTGGGPSVSIPAAACRQTSGGLQLVGGLGISGQALCQLPVGSASYAGEPASAPWADYEVPVAAGENRIEVRWLPTFPLTARHDLRYAIAIGGGQPQTVSIKTQATKPQWERNVVSGYAAGQTVYTAAQAGKVRLRISFVDPGLVLCAVTVTHAPFTH